MIHPASNSSSMRLQGRGPFGEIAWFMTCMLGPGMVNYLLTNNDETLLNTKTRSLKHSLADYDGQPDEQYIQFKITVPDEKKRANALHAETDAIEEAQ